MVTLPLNNFPCKIQGYTLSYGIFEIFQNVDAWTQNEIKIPCRFSIFKPDSFRGILNSFTNLGGFIAGPAFVYLSSFPFKRRMDI